MRSIVTGDLKAGQHIRTEARCRRQLVAGDCFSVNRTGGHSQQPFM